MMRFLLTTLIAIWSVAASIQEAHAGGAFDWEARYATILQAGLGNAPDSYPADGVTLLGSADIFHMARGFKELQGLGLGVSVFEGRDTSNERRYNSSWLPVYVYLPLHGKILPRQTFRSGRGEFFPFIYLWAGMNTWAADRGWVSAGIGVDWFLGLSQLDENDRPMPVSFGLRAGVVSSEAYADDDGLDLGRDTGVFVSIVAGLGGTYAR